MAAHLIIPAGFAALLLSLVHAGTPAMRFLEGVPRSAWLSAFGGVSVAYVFIHLLPELAEGQGQLSRAFEGVAFAERHVYLVALLGLTTFYGLERLAKRSRGERRGEGSGRTSGVNEGVATSAGVFWIHMVSFAIYNALVGYLLLHREKNTAASLFFFALAMATHFVVTDFGLNEDHKGRYRGIGRWILIVAVLAGYGVGAVIEISKAAIAVLVAFLAGGVILNVLKEEVPTERQSRFWAFALGLAGYAALLLAV